MKKLVITAALLTFAVVTPVVAQPSCPGIAILAPVGQLKSPQSYTVRWEPVPGATIYILEETRNPGNQEMSVTRTVHNVDGTSALITHESINDVIYHYRVWAVGSTVNCQVERSVKTFGDPVLRRIVRRGIVPVVGSTRGANGSLFKTYLRLEGAGLKGRVIFHQAGRVASDDDPSLPYDLTHTVQLEWDDIVATLGQSGIGSLSLVPDESAVGELPRATIRLNNVAADGLYGATAELYPGTALLDQSPFQRIEVPADGNFRVNVGARAVLDGSARAIVITADGLQKGTSERTFRAGEMIMGSSEAVYGIALEPGEVLLVTFSRAMIPFYTLTDNRTNDPFLYVQGAERNTSVETYVK